MRKAMSAIVLALFVGVIAACGSAKESGETGSPAPSAPASPASVEGSVDEPDKSEESGQRQIEYLGETYTVPANAERIVITGAVEAMEDAVVLDVHPVGAISFGGEFPDRFAKIVDQAESIGEKREPNFEAILKLDPDVILGTTKFGAEIVEQMQKIAPYIGVSHIAENWEANIRLLGELTGKEEQAEAAISQYHRDAEGAKAEYSTRLADSKVLAIRIREGEVNIYPRTVFVNPILYSDLGLQVPAEVEGANAQEVISYERLVTINPDYLFIQFSEEENADTQSALNDFMNDPVVKTLNAVKNGKVFVNAVHPLSEGGPALSRIEFLKAAKELLSE